MIYYLTIWFRLKNSDLSFKIRWSIFTEFGGYAIIAQILSALLLVIYAVKIKRQRIYLLIPIIVIVYLIFDIFLDRTIHDFNMV
jgi:hypothetical protein